MPANGKAAPQQTTTATTSSHSGWIAPVVILIIAAVLYVGGRKKSEVVQNPLVDIMVITVGVFAFAAFFRFSAVKMGNPGLASFFGAPTVVDNSNSPLHAANYPMAA